MPCGITKSQTDSDGEAHEAPSLKKLGRSLVQHPIQNRAMLSDVSNFILEAQGSEQPHFKYETSPSLRLPVPVFDHPWVKNVS